MTGSRTSAIWKPEKEYGVEDTSANWNRFPTGLTFTFSATNGFTQNYGIGSRYWESATAGKYSGTWTAKFEMDYKCIQILPAIFDTYSYLNGVHTFSKSPGRRCKSMTFRAKKMNRFVGGSEDQTFLIVGAVCSSISLDIGTKGVIDVTMSGFYKKDTEDPSGLNNTDWAEYYGDPSEVQTVEWSCLNIGGTPIATTERVNFSVNSGAESLLGCGERFACNYLEKTVSVSCTTSCYSYEPTFYFNRMYSGGFDKNSHEPMAKGLSPIPKISLKSSYDAFAMEVEMRDVLVDSVSMGEWGEGKIKDTPTLKPKDFTFTITSPTPDLSAMWGFQ